MRSEEETLRATTNLPRARSVLQSALADLADVPATSRWVRSGNANLHVLDYGGDLQPVVILPGITSPAIAMDFVARELVDLVRPISVDMRGRGLSDDARSYTLQDYVDDTLAVLDTLHLSAPVLVGHSMGARVAALAASQGARQLSGTVLVDPPMSSGPGRGPYPVAVETVLDQLAGATRVTDAEEMARLWPSWPNRERDLRARWLSTCAVEAVRETHAGFETDDFFSFWPGVPAPTALIYGGRSPMVTARDALEAQSSNPEARLVEVGGAGHMVFWDAPELGIAALRAVLADLINQNG
jgi:N-formylmaleamate deformylase